jgi:arginine/serine-rich splicing factor 7
MSSDSSSPKKEETNRIYVTAYSTKESEMEIRNAFAKYGEIQEFSWKGRFCFIVRSGSWHLGCRLIPSLKRQQMQ